MCVTYHLFIIKYSAILSTINQQDWLELECRHNFVFHIRYIDTFLNDNNIKLKSFIKKWNFSIHLTTHFILSSAVFHSVKIGTNICSYHHKLIGRGQFVRSFVCNTKRPSMKQSVKRQVSTNFQIYPGKTDD